MSHRVLLVVLALSLALPITGRADSPAATPPAGSAAPPPPALKDIGDGPGVVFVHDAAYGTRPVGVNELGPFTEYQVSVKCYHVDLNLPLGPLPADALLVSETSSVLRDGYPAFQTSIRRRQSYHPLLPVVGLDGKIDSREDERQLEFAFAETRIVILPPHLFPTPTGDLHYADGTAISNGRDAQLLHASDKLHAGDLELQVYLPGANRIEVNVEKRTGTRQLKYAEGDAVPELVTTATQFAPHAWLSASLSGTDLGWLFDDGVAADDQGPAWKPPQ